MVGDDDACEDEEKTAGNVMVRGDIGNKWWLVRGGSRLCIRDEAAYCVLRRIK